MNDVFEINERLRQSRRILHAWRWMVLLSANPQEVCVLLRIEARDLIELGRNFPEHARQIGKLIYAYHLLIKRVEAVDQSTIVSA